MTKRTIVAIMIAAIAVACSHMRPPEPPLVVAHSSGGPGPTITFVTIHENGVIELDTGGRKHRAQIDAEEANGVLTLARSPELQGELRQMKSRGYQSGCCDMEDIFLQVDGEVIEFPVWEFAASGPDVRETFLVPSGVARLLKRLDQIAGPLFPGRYDYPLSPRGGA